MPAEDFSFFGEKYPSVMVFLAGADTRPLFSSA